jgi:hypothetical protein
LTPASRPTGLHSSAAAGCPSASSPGGPGRCRARRRGRQRGRAGREDGGGSVRGHGSSEGANRRQAFVLTTHTATHEQAGAALDITRRGADPGATLTRISPRPRSRHCLPASNSNSAPSPAARNDAERWRRGRRQLPGDQLTYTKPLGATAGRDGTDEQQLKQQRRGPSVTHSPTPTHPRRRCAHPPPQSSPTVPPTAQPLRGLPVLRQTAGCLRLVWHQTGRSRRRQQRLQRGLQPELRYLQGPRRPRLPPRRRCWQPQN